MKKSEAGEDILDSLMELQEDVLPLCRICNPAAFGIRICNPLSFLRITNAHTYSGRIANPTERIPS